MLQVGIPVVPLVEGLRFPFLVDAHIIAGYWGIACLIFACVGAGATLFGNPMRSEQEGSAHWVILGTGLILFGAYAILPLFAITMMWLKRKGLIRLSKK